jgi:nucleotide-binding universal stress UspA family protein
MFRKILVPLDGSELAERALGPAMAIARHGLGQITLVRVPVTEARMVPALTGYDLPWSEPADSDHIHQAAAYLSALATSHAQTGLVVHARVPDGDVPGVIVDTALEDEVDLIVMSSHGYSGITRWMLGSVTEKVLRGAPCPVLAVRAAEPIRKILVTLDGSDLSEQALEPALSLAASLKAEVTLLRVADDITEYAFRDLENGNAAWASAFRKKPATKRTTICAG